MSNPQDDKNQATQWAGKPADGTQVTQTVEPAKEIAVVPAPETAAEPLALVGEAAHPHTLLTPRDGYAVYLFPAATEALGNIIRPYLSTTGDPHILCREVDTGGALIEMTLEADGGEGRSIDIELMLPTNMVRMIVTVKSDGNFGFARKPVQNIAG